MLSFAECRSVCKVRHYTITVSCLSDPRSGFVEQQLVILRARPLETARLWASVRFGESWTYIESIDQHAGGRAQVDKPLY
jgi:hypothetical protein